MKRVAVTGIGAVSPLGLDAATTWRGLVEGRSGFGPITLAAVRERLTQKTAAEVKDFRPADHFPERRLPALDRVSQLALVAAREAAAGSGLAFGNGLGDDTAVVIGTGVGGMTTLDEGYRRIFVDGQDRLHPLSVPKLMANAPASQISMEFGLRGPAYAVASACASAAHAIGQAFHMVRSGMVRCALAGGAEACVAFGTLKGWEALRVMAPDLCRPFSRGRLGLILGEGAAVLVLEPWDVAAARGADILGEIAGFGMSADAADLTSPDEAGMARAMTAALTDARLAPETIGHVNAHGTGTLLNDRTETAALKRVFGPHAPRLAVSSSKSMLGHALGAAGALEAVATLFALREGVIPPTANYLGPDPDCDLDYVPNAARKVAVDAALSNSFAFGGLNAVLAFRRV